MREKKCSTAVEKYVGPVETPGVALARGIVESEI